MGGLWWKVIAALSILGISISLYRLCSSSCSLQYASIGGTTLYVVMLLMLHFPTTIRIYKEHEPPLPATRTLLSLIPMTAIYYISFNYPTVDVLVYIYSMFAFGFAMFQLNSPMQFQHARCTLIFGFYIGFSGRLIGQFCSTVSCPIAASLFWIYFHAKALSMGNGFYI
ncbi:hypothetical protein DY000_02015279 [Brassica cretica]|uniref:Uncharacterized protein n=1 Tax=Brassica cretica TaxID=69181 RepID=A0ABQ7CKE8_BRACR|nr:hypothetical protein DY000_02015279 [Brassica cretica]